MTNAKVIHMRTDEGGIKADKARHKVVTFPNRGLSLRRVLNDNAIWVEPFKEEKEYLVSAQANK